MANEVRAYLSAHGIDCWLARDGIPPGASWGEAIVDALTASDVLVLIYSSHANASNQVERELALAFEDGIPIVPFRTDDSEVSDGIRVLHRRDSLAASQGG